MHLGFTGTSGSVTRAQRQTLKKTLEWLFNEGYKTLHHGDCIGADALAHDLAKEIGYAIIIHPPVNANKRAFKKSETILPEKPYLPRNIDVVEASKFLVACPSGPEKIRSGTWYTVRYARRFLKETSIITIWPDGSTT